MSGKTVHDGNHPKYFPHFPSLVFPQHKMKPNMKEGKKTLTLGCNGLKLFFFLADALADKLERFSLLHCLILANIATASPGLPCKH
jgi:hypothetical protein